MENNTLKKEKKKNKKKKKTKKTKKKEVVEKDEEEKDTNCPSQPTEKDETESNNNDVMTSSDEDDPLKNSIVELRNKLSIVIDINYGLLDELLSTGVLDVEQVEIIKSKASTNGKVLQLLDDIISTSSEQREQFMTALERTQQKHVVNFIRLSAQRPTDNADEWPTNSGGQEISMIFKHWSKLVQLIDPRNGLTDEMLSAACINNRQKQDIDSSKLDTERNDKLLNILYRKSIADFNAVISCLVQTKQQRVVSLLTTGRDDGWDSTLLTRLSVNHATLVALIDTKCGLLAELLSADCITWRQKEFVETAASQSESNARMLEIMKRGRESDFDIFIECLSKTGQQHVCRILLEDGAVVHMHATNSGTDNTKQDEAYIVEQFMTLLRNTNDSKREHLRDKVNQQVDDLQSRGVQTIALSTEGSIGVFYICTSLSGFWYLRELYDSGELKWIVQQLFVLLLNNADEPALATIFVDTLVCDWSKLTSHVEYLCASMGLLAISETYQVAHHLQDGSTDTTLHDVNITIHQFPYELIEMLLVKTAGQIFVKINRATPRAEIYTLVLLSTVSFAWWKILTCRPYNKTLLRHYFRHVCHPYKCNAQQMNSINVEGDRNVWGVAKLNNKLYSVCAGSNTIQVFTSSPHFSRLEDIKVEGLNDPSDIFVCSETRQLYITDRQQYAIWRVNLMSYKQVDKFITTQWVPWSLSIKSRRLLITPFDGDALFIYGDDGVQLNRIPLPDYMWASHAVESSRNTYIVSHYKRSTDDTQSEHKDGVSEVDVDGRIIRQFNNQPDSSFQFNRPNYFLLDASNQVIVADWRNKRIVLLKPDLQLKRVLIPKLQGQPTRMCFNEETGLLFVACYLTAEISVYKSLVANLKQCK